MFIILYNIYPKEEASTKDKYDKDEEYIILESTTNNYIYNELLRFRDIWGCHSNLSHFQKIKNYFLKKKGFLIYTTLTCIFPFWSFTVSQGIFIHLY